MFCVNDRVEILEDHFSINKFDKGTVENTLFGEALTVMFDKGVRVIFLDDEIKFKKIEKEEGLGNG